MPWQDNKRMWVRLIPGTAEFEEAFNRITTLADLATGAKFLDKSTLTHVEGNYDFKNIIDVIGITSWSQLETI